MVLQISSARRRDLSGGQVNCGIVVPSSGLGTRLRFFYVSMRGLNPLGRSTRVALLLIIETFDGLGVLCMWNIR